MSSNNSNQDFQGDGGSGTESSGTKQKRRLPRRLTAHRRLKILQFVNKNRSRYHFEDTVKLEWQEELLSFLEESPRRDVRISDVADWLTKYAEFFRKAFRAASGILEPIDPLSGDSLSEASSTDTAPDEPPRNPPPPLAQLSPPVPLPFQLPPGWASLPGEQWGPGRQHQFEQWPWRNPLASDVLWSSANIPPRQAPVFPPPSRPHPSSSAPYQIPPVNPPRASQQDDRQRLILLNPSTLLNQTFQPKATSRPRIVRPSPYPQNFPQPPPTQPLGRDPPSPPQNPSGPSTTTFRFGSFEDFLQTFAGNPGALPGNPNCVKSTAKILIGMLGNVLRRRNLTPELQEEYGKLLKTLLSFIRKLEGEGQAPSAAGNA